MASRPTPDALEPYHVEVDTGGCERCGHGKTWTVVGPDDMAHSVSWEDQEEAEDFARAMNCAYAAGRAADPGVGGRPEPCGDEHDMRNGDDWQKARCGLAVGHLGSHEGMAHGHRWFWNAHAAGIMRDFHPTTNAPLQHRPLADSLSDGPVTMTKKQLREQRRAEKETEAEGRDVRAAADVRPVMNEPDHLADAIARVLGPNDRDDDIPVETRRELMQCAVSNGRISYYYLCNIWRRGKLAGKGCHMDLKRLVIDLQAHAKEHGWQDTDEPISALLAWRPGVGGGSSSPWQNIETAPKDQIALFWTVQQYEPPAFVRPNLGRLSVGKYGHWSSLEKATHWMPLPSPPAAETEP